MGIKPSHKKKNDAFLMRIEGLTFREIGRKLKITHATVSKWENGWVDTKGRRFPGWKEELARLQAEMDQEMLSKGLMLKRKRLETYERVAMLALEKLEEQFPNITAKSATDMKALTSEIRELLKQIAVEKGEYRQGDQTLIAVKADITLNELQERYRNAQGHNKDDAD